MTKIEEILDLKLDKSTFTFSREWLRDLQKELKDLTKFSDMWVQVDRTKLKDCLEDKAAILADLKNLLERWHEQKLVFRDYDEIDDLVSDEEEEYK